MSSFTNPTHFRWRTIRIFISSTFRDFHAERDHLVKYVFPELRQWCQQWKLHLVDIDLRWGVTKEEADSGKVVDICLKEIDGSRPFFISMLGSRYGWVPGVDEIPPDTFRHYTKLDGAKGLSVTHLEIMHAVLDPLTSVDVVEQVPHAYFYFRDGSSLPEPGKLSGLSGEQIDEYSKTFIEQDAGRISQLANLKKDIEAHYARLGVTNQNPQELEQRIFSYQPVFDPALSNSEDDALKGRFTRDSLKTFGDRVKNDLTTAIGRQFEERIKALSEKREDNKLESERDLQDSFVENRTRLFVGRTDLIKQLHEYVTTPAGKILAVRGQPGSGKSALLAHFYRLIIDSEYSGIHGGKLNSGFLNLQSGIRNPEFVIPDFIGASPASTSLHSTLTRFCEEIKAKFGLTDEIPFDTNKLIDTFADFLKKCTSPTLIILDGLNQLDEFDNAHDLSWLPAELPENVSIIASSLDGDTWDALVLKTDRIMDVTALSEAERREIIAKMPSVFCKTLDEKNTGLLLAKEQTSNPLYLKVALDELRVFGSHEKLPSRIGSLSGNVVDLYVDMLNRLSSEMAEKYGPEKGELLVERLFCLLECSRYGLTDKELQELMQEHDPDLDHIAIIRQLRDYFFYRDDVLDFFHRALSKAVRKKYFCEENIIPG